MNTSPNDFSLLPGDLDSNVQPPAGQDEFLIGSYLADPNNSHLYLYAIRPNYANPSQTVFTGNYTMDAGTQAFGWNGQDNNGMQWPDGNYTLTITAQDASGASVAVPTEIEGTVDSADLTQTPPVLSIDGQNYTLDKIKRVVRTQ